MAPIDIYDVFTDQIEADVVVSFLFGAHQKWTENFFKKKRINAKILQDFHFNSKNAIKFQIPSLSKIHFFQWFLQTVFQRFKPTLRGQTVHWIGAHFCVCMFLDSIDKALNMFQNVSGFHLQNFHGFRVQIPVTLTLSAHLLRRGFRNKRI